MKRFVQRSSVWVSILAVLPAILTFVDLADAGITNVASYSSSSVSGDFSYYDPYSGNYYSASVIGQSQTSSTVNSPAAVSGTYNGYPYYPNISASATGVNYTDYSNYIEAHSVGQAFAYPNSYYGGYAEASASATSYVNFTLTAPSTGYLFVEAYASTGSTGGYGSTQASANAYLTDYATGITTQYTASSANGSAYDYYNTFFVTLNAGDYRLGFSSVYDYGYAYNSGVNGPGYSASEYASGTAELYSIQEIVQPVQPTDVAVPEPASAAVWLLVAGMYGVAGRGKRVRSRLAS